jgi:hypothetical protein
MDFLSHYKKAEINLYLSSTHHDSQYYGQGRIQGEEWGGPKQRKKKKMGGGGPELKKNKIKYSLNFFFFWNWGGPWPPPVPPPNPSLIMDLGKI